MNRNASCELFKKAARLIPGGVNSPARAYKSVAGSPVFIKSAKGSNICDIDGNHYIDYVCAWGTIILGHAHDEVVKAIIETTLNGTCFGIPISTELSLASKILEAYPSMDKVRMVNSGTEATMSAIRLARGFTGRDRIIKFEGCYHGHVDHLLPSAGPTAALNSAGPAGVPRCVTKNTFVLPYNDLDAFEEVVRSKGEKIAAVIVEPVAGNMGCVLPGNNFLKKLRRLTTEFGILLIFDEVMTGFRVAYGGSCERYGVRPDLVCLGKIVGGGLPIGAYCGVSEVMEFLAPEGPVYQAGTFSGNPLSMIAGLVTLQVLSRSGVYEGLERKTIRLVKGLEDAAKGAGVNLTVNSCGSMWTAFFSNGDVVDLSTALRSDTKIFAEYFALMLNSGINLVPSQFETNFLSLAHSEDDIDRTIESAAQAFTKLSKNIGK